MKCILKYLRRTKDLFIVYGEKELKLKGYIDLSFQLDLDDSKSTSEFLFTLTRGAHASLVEILPSSFPLVVMSVKKRPDCLETVWIPLEARCLNG